MGLQINFCKSPSCSNFGVPIDVLARRGARANDQYIVMSANGIPMGQCNACGEYFPLKSNLGIYEEFRRVNLSGSAPASCPNLACANHLVDVDGRLGNYQSFGRTPIGAARYRCKACKTTFSIKPAGINPIAKQRQADKNPMILRMLCGKMPHRRIREAAGVTGPVFFQRLDFFFQQASQFMAARESRMEELGLRRLYIGTDRQDHSVNWSHRDDKRNVIVTAVASADNGSGYVFGMDVNFDPGVDYDKIAGNVKSEVNVTPPFRRHARLWLPQDFRAAAARSKKRVSAGGLAGAISDAYQDSQGRADVESTERVSLEERLPVEGMLVHAEYTLYGHFQRLQRMVGQVEKVRCFVDQDSGMRAACLGSFADRIKRGEVDAFYVSINARLTVDEKRKAMKAAAKAFRDVAEGHPTLTEEQVKLLLLRDRIAHAQTMGPWKDRWVVHPLPSMSEPEKAMCYLTDRGDYDLDHRSWLYNKASLHGVDSWFNQIRRRSSMLERPIGSHANRGRVWSGYSAYRPGQLQKLMTIYRACHNYIWLAEGQKQTPAMRLGLAKAPLNYKDLIYFSS
ncbi:MAG: transposase [Stenotrophobium sp.]